MKVVPPDPLTRVSVKCTGVKNNGSGIRIEVEFWRRVCRLESSLARKS